MNIASINTVMLFYIGIFLALIFVAIMVYTGRQLPPGRKSLKH